MVFIPKAGSLTSVSPTRKKTTDEKYARDQMKFTQDEMRMSLDQERAKAPPTVASNSTYSQRRTQPAQPAGAKMQQPSPAAGLLGGARGSESVKTAQNTPQVPQTQLNTGGGGISPTGRLEPDRTASFTSRTGTGLLPGPGSLDALVGNAVGGFDRGQVGQAPVDAVTGVKIARPNLQDPGLINEQDTRTNEDLIDERLRALLEGQVDVEAEQELIRQMVEQQTAEQLRGARARMGRAGFALSGAMQAGEGDIMREAGLASSAAQIEAGRRGRAEEREMFDQGLDAFLRGEELERGRVADAITISMIAEQLGISPEELLASLGGGGGGGAPGGPPAGSVAEGTRTPDGQRIIGEADTGPPTTGQQAEAAGWIEVASDFDEYGNEMVTYQNPNNPDETVRLRAPLRTARGV